VYAIRHTRAACAITDFFFLSFPWSLFYCHLTDQTSPPNPGSETARSETVHIDIRPARLNPAFSGTAASGGLESAFGTWAAQSHLAFFDLPPISASLEAGVAAAKHNPALTLS
jgi:hypothetical protein